MNMTSSVTLSVTLSFHKAKQLLDWLCSETEPSASTPSDVTAAMQLPGSEPREFRPPQAYEELAHLLHGESEKLVRFVVRSQGKFYNDELAKELGLDDPYTAFELGRITRKLRRVGLSAEGFRGTNWYRKRRVAGRTLITVRPDALMLLQNAINIKTP